jgi:hypothetical protein
MYRYIETYWELPIFFILMKNDFPQTEIYSSR